MTPRFDKSLPKSVSVGHRTIALGSVEYDYDFHSALGVFVSWEERIQICITGEPLKDANTLLHEIMHVIYDQYLLDDDKYRGKGKDSDMVRKGDQARAEERIVNSMANGVIEVYSRNPKVAAWITERTMKYDKRKV